MSEPIGIYRKIVKLRVAVGAIKKDRSGAGINYKFRGYEALFEALRPAMDSLGLVLATGFEPSGEPSTYTTGKGGTGTFCAGVFVVDIIDSDDGSKVRYESPYVALDTSDKAAGKAASYAIKTALFTGLMVPTDDLPEHDAERPEVPDRTRPTRTPEESAALVVAKYPRTAWAGVVENQIAPKYGPAYALAVTDVLRLRGEY